MHSLPTHVGIAWMLVSDFNQIDSLFKFYNFFDSKRAAPYWNTFFIFLLSRVNEHNIISLLKKYAKDNNWWLIDAIIDNGDYDTIEEHIQAIPKAKKCQLQIQCPFI